MVSRRAIDLIVIPVVMIAAMVYFAGGSPDPAPAAGLIGWAMLGLAALAPAPARDWRVCRWWEASH
jgi:hypothetical protein